MDLVAKATSSKIRPIGRLGRNSLGLILFTNDEKLHAKFTNSKHGVARLFQVTLDSPLQFEHLKQIQEGFKHKGKLIRVEAISYVEGAKKNEIGIKIKNTGNTLLRTIEKIDCVSIGPLTKKDLPRGHWKHLSAQELSLMMML
jgi:23S rRNA pseudouridine2605 synthase